jgi:glycosyltransferase involved in cell wall biosynthesis
MRESEVQIGNPGLMLGIISPSSIWLCLARSPELTWVLSWQTFWSSRRKRETGMVTQVRKHRLRVLLTDSYLMRFNAARRSEHLLVWKKFGDSKWGLLDGIALCNPFESSDLVHTFNKIPLTRRPWIVSFESYLPRTFGKHEMRGRNTLREQLLSPKCSKIIAISEYARRKFAYYNRGWSGLVEAVRKMEVVYPNIPLQTTRPKSYAGGELSLIFVGNHFARKGGVVAVRLARAAKERGLPIRVHVISSLAGIGTQYTDYQDRSKYLSDLELLKLDNVVYHGSLPNAEGVRLMGECHFQFLATIDDTFGFSVLEGLSAGTPCIATSVCALPEIVKPGVNGHLLSMQTNENGNWKFLEERDWEILDTTYTRLANETLDWIAGILEEPQRYEVLSSGAIEQVRQHHDIALASKRFDAMYVAAVGAHRS